MSDAPAERSDRDLLLALQAGDETALDGLIDVFGQRVRSFLGHLVGSSGWADDLTQETFVRIYERAEQYRVEHEVSVWVFRIARNLALDLLRREKVRRRVQSIETEGRLPDVGPGPLAELERREFEELMTQSIAKLPETFRSVFVLRDVEQLSYEEIAAVLEISPKTVSSRLHRARCILRDELQEYLES